MRSHSRRVSALAYLVGDAPRPRTLVGAACAGLALGLVAFFFTDTSTWQRVVLFALAFDIGAGWVSNLSESTRSFWKKRSRALQVSYIVIHLGLYPVALWVLTDSVWVWGLLLIALLGKLGAFVVGVVFTFEESRAEYPSSEHHR